MLGGWEAVSDTLIATTSPNQRFSGRLWPRLAWFVDLDIVLVSECWCVSLLTLVLSLLDVCVLSLVAIEPWLHAKIWLSVPLV